jgi:hypothetical protein
MPDSDSVRIDVASKTNFFVRQLEVVPELLGAAMDFAVHGAQVRIQLPGADDVAEGGILVDGEPVKPFAKATEGYRMHDVVAQYHVHRLDVLTYPTEQPEVPNEVLRLPPVQIQMFSAAQRERMKAIAGAADMLAIPALDLWVRVLRWKTLNGAICRPAVVAPSRERTYLTERATGHRFWATPSIARKPCTRSVIVQQWADAQAALQRGESAPIWFDLVFDAGEHLKLGDLNRTVVDLAVGCEVYMKRRTMEALPQGLSESARRHLDRARVRDRRYKMFEETLSAAAVQQFLPLRNSLDELFDARNTVVHGGANANLVEADCLAYRATALALISLRP